MIRCLPVAGALMLAVGAAAAGTAGQRAGPTTLAEVRGSVGAVAQDGTRIAWIRTEARCARRVQMLTLPRRRAVYVGRPRAAGCGRGLRSIAVSAEGRVLWQGVTDEGNTYFGIALFTAAHRDRRTRLIPGSVFYKSSNPDEFDEPEPVPIAADGKTILFYAVCDTGELCFPNFRKPAIYRLAGGSAKRLAKIVSPVGLAVRGRRFAVVTKSLRCCNFSPAWSHDGTRVAWIYDGNLWTVRADGTGDRQLAAGVAPRIWNPDDARRPSWSPDDARLVFERWEAKRSHGVYRVDATGRGLRRLAVGTAPSWSPDGRRIALVRGTGVYTVNPDGTGVTKLTATARATTAPLSWSPDSKRIAVSRGNDIYSVPADGRGETRLTTSRLREVQPAWSPDGARIAYVDGSMIAVVNADGSGAKRLTRGGDRSPAWSPDSKRIAFMREADLWVMNADGTGQRRLVQTDAYAPQWAPGSAIMVGDGGSESAGFPSNPGIRLVSHVDGKTRKIAPVLHSSVEVRDVSTGRLFERFRIDGHARAIALGPDYVAMLVDLEPGMRVELYNLNGSFRRAAEVPRNVSGLSAAGRTVVFATTGSIRRLDARTGAVTTLAAADRMPVGLSIEGRRVVWAENRRGAARIRAVTAP